jgi:hypothetical protein
MHVDPRDLMFQTSKITCLSCPKANQYEYFSYRYVHPKSFEYQNSLSSLVFLFIPKILMRKKEREIKSIK